MSRPTISVVMPVYNAGDYLIDAVASILSQSTTDWEMICVNDGSQDHSATLLDWFSRLDSRIRVIHQPNSGIVAALNRGIQAATGELICRMDCDDIAIADRLEKQSRYMHENPECAVVGGAILQIDEDGDPLGVQQIARDHDAIVQNLLTRRTGHFHPTTMIRSCQLEDVGAYRSAFEWIEDHDLWLRLSRLGKLANLDDVVLCYRQHASSVCWQRSDTQRKLMNRLLQEAYQERNLSLPPEYLLPPAGQRSKAGSGKWLRMAARNGHVRSAWKHARRTLTGSDRWSYKLRMSAEALLRLLVSTPHRLMQGSPSVPVFPDWHARASQVHDDSSGDSLRSAPSAAA